MGNIYKATTATLEAPVQMELLGLGEERLRLQLEHCMGSPLQLIITDNASSIILYKPAPKGGRGTLRLHRMFLHAGSEVIHALARWVIHRRAVRAGAIVDAFIRGHKDLIRPSSPRRQIMRTAGRIYDLKAMYEEINALAFDGKVDAVITWGRGVHTRHRRRSIRFGSYSAQEHLIRIHPALDQDFVPAYFVRYVVYHEMLHAAMGIGGEEGSRRRLHPPEFRLRERACPWYDQAIAWQSDPANLRKMLR